MARQKDVSEGLSGGLGTQMSPRPRHPGWMGSCPPVVCHLNGPPPRPAPPLQADCQGNHGGGRSVAGLSSSRAL